jgi:riboflavin synthase
MFSGIIEATGVVTNLTSELGNLHIEVESPFTGELKIDQSVAHNGVCLTVVEISGNRYTVTAIEETLNKTNFNSLSIDDEVNLERCMQLNARLDGHIVQGHVDKIAECIGVEDQDGSTMFTFRYEGNEVTVEKGSITVNGISLTVVNSKSNEFSVCIIPYTIEHTNLKHVSVGTQINLEFDIIGKYVAKLMTK